ncbi:MAG: YhbY family RNA-binding protein [Candidatus Nanoarchaeia archaeon]
MDQRIKRLRAKSKALEPIANIGKEGLTEGVIKDIKRQLNDKKLIKIKVSKLFYGDANRKQKAKEVAEATNSTLIDQVGFVIVLSKN